MLLSDSFIDHHNKLGSIYSNRTVGPSVCNHGFDDYDRCNSCMIVTVEIAVTLMDVKVVAGVLNGTDEMRDSCSGSCDGCEI